jgi:hypothetical protein
VLYWLGLAVVGGEAPLSYIGANGCPNRNPLLGQLLPSKCNFLSSYFSGEMLKKITRRNFLKIAGLGSLGLAAGCTTFPKNVNWHEVPDSEFSISKFNDWFEAHKLYNGINPNLGIGMTGKGPTFYMSMRSGWTPGIDYSSNFMYAVADGIVAQVGKRDTTPFGPNRMGGNLV